MTPTDLPFADSLRKIAGWNQTLEDWKRFLELEPDGCFVAEHNGAPAGVATTICYEETVAWVGMLLVHPNARGKGIGTGLLEHCLEHLGSRAVPCIKLDATPEGQPLYEKLGFRPEWTLTRWEGNVAGSSDSPLHNAPECCTLRGAKNREELHLLLDRIQKMDRAAFGVSRRHLLARLLPAAESIAWVPSPGGDSALAYGLLRRGSRALYLGPTTATKTDAGLSVARELLGAAAGEPLFWDIPESQTAVKALAQSLGFTRQRSFLRMNSGENLAPGHPEYQLTIADPALG